ncbi:hypothetical protein GQ457_10G007390 [Hibiscus cannabinus]
MNPNVKRSREVGPMDAFIKSPTPTWANKEPFDETYKKEQREKACVDFTKWMYDVAIPFNALTYPNFKDFIGMKPSSAYEVRVPFLNKEVANINENMRNHIEEWAKTVCYIISNGWVGVQGQSLFFS